MISKHLGKAPGQKFTSTPALLGEFSLQMTELKG